MRASRRLAGFTLAELLVTLLLSQLILWGAWSVLSTLRRSVESLSSRAQGLETVRTVFWILDHEMGLGEGGVDWWVAGEDSVQLRAFRGHVLVEGPEPDGRWQVCVSGLRRPNLAKDSVLLLEDGGGWTGHALESRRRMASECPSGWNGWMEEWVLEPQPSSPTFGRYFERGSYHLVNGAFRYRRGYGGRQPLTPEDLLTGRFRASGPKGEVLSWALSTPGSQTRDDSILWRGRTR